VLEEFPEATESEDVPPRFADVLLRRADLYRAGIAGLTSLPTRFDPLDLSCVVSVQCAVPELDDDYRHISTGVLVSPELAVAPASAFHPAAQPPGAIPATDLSYLARLGGRNFHDGTERILTHIVCHEGFRPHTGERNVAVLRLDQPAPAGVTPIMLSAEPAQVGDEVVILGWPRDYVARGQFVHFRTTLLDPRISGRPGTLCAANLPAPHGLGVGCAGAAVIRVSKDRGACLIGIVTGGAEDIRIVEGDNPIVLTDLVGELDFITAAGMSGQTEDCG
jgi:hypothetical protein